MSIALRAGAALFSAATLFVAPLAAQRVSADVVIRQGPVSARVVVGDEVYRRPERVVIVEREYVPPPRVVYVERYRAPRGRAHGWWRKQGYHRTVVWVDRDGRYFDRYDERYVGLREVRVYGREGRYYHDDD